MHHLGLLDLGVSPVSIKSREIYVLCYRARIFKGKEYNYWSSEDMWVSNDAEHLLTKSDARNIGFSLYAIRGRACLESSGHMGVSDNDVY